MAYLIGTDEAGYGPNLGPLVVAATTWQVPDDWLPDNLYDHLAGVISTRPADDSLLVLADSKSLYDRGKGLGLLETHVLAALQTTGVALCDWADAWQCLTRCTIDGFDGIPWLKSYTARLPLHASADQVAKIVARVLGGLNDRSAWINRPRAVALFPERFNDLVDQFGNKAAVLSHVTIELARELMESCDGQRVLIHCDKHGGRNRYMALLQHFFPDPRIRVVVESRQQSVYRWTDSGRDVEVRFVAKGERFPPSALASMIAKYLRELSMHAFNEYWQQQIPGIRPTAGYPVDAQRFKTEISGVQRQLNIDDRILWRNR